MQHSNYQVLFNYFLTGNINAGITTRSIANLFLNLFDMFMQKNEVF